MNEPRISDDLDATFDNVGDADSSLMDSVAEEFAERCRRGESPSVDEYARRYPEHASALRDLLPSVAMMEQLKRQIRRSSSAADEAEPVPERLGEYRIVRELGRGGMGIVYEAFQESLGRHVALKVIPRHGLLEPKRRRRFQREATAVAQLHHTNIVPIFAAGEHDGLPYYAMQYIRGRGLDRLLDRWRWEKMVPGADHWRFVAKVGMQAAEALQYAHAQGILHRDIKPANVLIDEHQVAWITDFGLAKLLGRDELTNSGDVVGTLRYMAPEALKGRTDRRGDVYSLGLTLYELLTRKVPFGDVSPSELLRCVTEEQPTRPRTLDRSIPVDLETIILKATAREPAHRYQTAGEMAEDLRAFLDDRPIRARRASPPERLARWYRRNKLLATATSIAAISILAALGAVTWGYVTKARALEKEVENTKIALQGFSRLFDEFSDPEDAGPFAAKPTGGGSPGGAPPDQPGGPRRPLGVGMPGLPGLPPPGLGEKQPIPPHGGDPRGRPGPGMGRRIELSERESAVLETVLDFYDRFAKRNETNSDLEGEAAKAYRKMAAIYRVLQLDPMADEKRVKAMEQKAADAQAKAIERFRMLVGRHGEDSEYSYDLARTLALDGPGAEAVPLERAEPDLRQAIAIVERLFERAAPDWKKTYAAALARWNGHLGRKLEESGRTDEALERYRTSIAHDEWLAENVDDPRGVRAMLVFRRAGLGRLLAQLDRKADARPVMARAADDVVRQVEAEESPGPRRKADLIAKGLEDLASICRDVGDERRAARLEAVAQSMRERAYDDRPPHHDGGGFADPKKGHHGNGRGRMDGPSPRSGVGPH